MAKDLYQLTILVDIDGNFSENVLFFENSKTNSTTPAVDAAHLMDGWQIAGEGQYTSAIPAVDTLIGYKAKRINNGGGPSIALTASGVGGVRTGALGNTATAPCITFPISNGTRFVTGKIFIPGVTITDCVDNNIQAGLQTALDTFVTALLAPFTSGGNTYVFVIYSRKLGISLGTPTGHSFAATIGIQRRRRLPVM